MKRIILLAGLLSIPSTQSFADGSGYKICNKSPDDFVMSFIYRSGLGLLADRWRWKGYYNLPSGECGTILDTHAALNIFINLTHDIKGRELGRDIYKKLDQFRSTNMSAHEGDKFMCVYGSGKVVTQSLSDFEDCDSAPDKRYYTIYWTGIALTHQQVNRQPHTLTIK